MGRDQEAQRVFRIGQICDIVSKCKDGADSNRLIAEFMCKYGVARRTMLEYIQALIFTDKLKQEGGRLFYIGEIL